MNVQEFVTVVADKLKRFPRREQASARELMGATLEALIQNGRATKALTELSLELGKNLASEVKGTAVQMSDVRIASADEVHLWSFAGDANDALYPTKMAAEIAARVQFPDEPPGARYARVRYSTYHKE